MSQTTANTLIEIADKIKDLQYEQMFGLYSSFSNFYSSNKKYCALGGVAKNMGISEYDLFIKGGKFTHDFITNKLRLSQAERLQTWQCNKCELVRTTLQIITHLNDVHHIKFADFPKEVQSIKPISSPPSNDFKVFYVVIKQQLNNLFKK